MNLKPILSVLFCAFLLPLTAMAPPPAKKTFTPTEQQQISVPTPGLFARSDAFSIDFAAIRNVEYSFPLPVGKAATYNGNALRITTSKGDAVKAMFDGYVRLSRHNPSYGNVIVVRHDNGLETVYGWNAQNLVKVGDHVQAGQTIAIVGNNEGDAALLFAILVNGSWVNPQTVIDIRSHHLIRQTLLFKKNGNRVNIVNKEEPKPTKRGITSLDPDDEVDNPFGNDNTFKIDLQALEKEHWSYPLPGSHVISPYGGRRNHAGVDIKTKPNDDVLAAFDGVVTQSGPYFGYGNCIVIRHAYGFETLYSHQSKNFVKKGDHVKAGQVIGLTGRTGRATTEHLHFETHFKGRRFNPALIFDHTSKRLQAATLVMSKNGKLTSTKR